MVRCAPILALCVLAAVPARSQEGSSDPGWAQFRGPNVDGVSPEQDVFPAGAGVGLAIGWRRDIGEGYSGISLANGLAVTMHQDDGATFVVALDAASGAEQWRFAIGPPYAGLNGSFAGPISTPLITGNAVVAMDRRGGLAGVDVSSGDLLWSVDLAAEYGSVAPFDGFGTSPILLAGTAIVQIGAPDAAFAGFDPASGRRLWALGSDSIHFQTPVPVTLNGRRHLLAAGGTTLSGIDPATGELLWQYEHGGHDPAGAQSMVPVVAGTGRVLLTNKHASASMVELETTGGSVVGREIWEQRTIRNTYNVPVYHDGYLYAYSSRFLVCVDAETGERVWRSRPPGDGFLILVDGHLLIVTKRGALSVVKASPDGYEEVASLELFDDLVWTPPTFVNGSLYARSMSEIARVDILPASRLTDAGAGGDPDAEASLVADGQFERFLAEVEAADDKAAVIDRFLEAVDQFPLIEGERRVHFIYRGPGDDLAVASDVFGLRQERWMARVPDTDVFHYSVDIDPDARVNYHFVRDYAEILDPLNPRSTTTGIYRPEMDLSFTGDDPMPVSWLSMPRWDPPAHLVPVADNARRGRLERHELQSTVLDRSLTVDVYLPAGYDDDPTRRYPVAYYHAGNHALERGELQTSLDNLLGTEVRPLIAVFIESVSQFGVSVAHFAPYMEMWAGELVPFVDATYRTVATREGRASIGGGFPGYTALLVAFGRSDLVGKAAGITPLTLVVEAPKLGLQELIRTPAEQSMDLYVEWGRYDVRSPEENGDVLVVTRELLQFLTSRGYAVAGGEVPDGSGWSSWKNRTDVVLKTLFPAE